MYAAAPHREQDPARLAALLAEHAFATLVSAPGGVPVASHVPLVREPGRDGAGGLGTLVGHVARANPHWRAFDGCLPALAVFAGPHGYVSPRWYAGAPRVPTWNYVAVHARGTPQRVEDPERARAILRRAVEAFEGTAPGAWRMEEQPEGFVDRMLCGTVAFEMPIDALEGVRKLSQDKDPADRRGVLAGLRAAGHAPLARAMEEGS